MRSLTPNSPTNDVVYTPPALAFALAQVLPYKSTDIILDPSCGQGVFADSIDQKILELDIARSPKEDFFLFNDKVDWIITNPPWSEYRNFSKHAYEISDNVAYLVTINHDLATKARLRDMREANFGIKKIFLFDTPKAKEFPKWPQSGFQLGCVWKQKNYKGKFKFKEIKWQ